MTYAEFWPIYLRAHATPLNRLLHYLGTVMALVALLMAVIYDAAFIVAAPVIGYAFAWFGHFVVEGNKPATFGHPFYSLFSDFRMLGLAATCRLGPHLARAQDSFAPDSFAKDSFEG